MQRLALALALIALLAWAGIAQPETKEHVPGYVAELSRDLHAVTFSFRDRSGQQVILDELSGGSNAQYRITRIDGEHAWRVPSWLDLATCTLHAGTASTRGLPPGEYELEAGLGHYGRLRHPFTIDGKADKPQRHELQTPHARKVVKVRIVDTDGKPIKAVVSEPTYSAEIPNLRPRDCVLPDPVLRLAPAPLNGGGGFAHRRRRPGGVSFVLSDDGYYYVTVFDKSYGGIHVPLGERWFGKKSSHIDAPLDKAEYVVEVEPTAALRETLAGEFKATNKDDPGLKKRSVPVRPVVETPRAGWLHPLKSSPTLRAWARECEVYGDVTGKLSARLTPDGVQIQGEREALSDVLLTNGSDGKDISSLWGAESISRDMRLWRTRGLRMSVWADGDGSAPGLFFRALDADGRPARFVEATLIPLEEDDVATKMRKLESELAAKGKRPPPPAELGREAQQTLHYAVDRDNEDLVKDALGEEAFNALQDKAFRMRFAKYGGWYDSVRRLDGDADGYVIAPHFKPEKDKLYALYIWAKSRDDLKPDVRMVVRGQGESTDLGVVRLPK